MKIKIEIPLFETVGQNFIQSVFLPKVESLIIDSPKIHSYRLALDRIYRLYDKQYEESESLGNYH